MDNLQNTTKNSMANLTNDVKDFLSGNEKDNIKVIFGLTSIIFFISLFLAYINRSLTSGYFYEECDYKGKSSMVSINKIHRVDSNISRSKSFKIPKGYKITSIDTNNYCSTHSSTICVEKTISNWRYFIIYKNDDNICDKLKEYQSTSSNKKRK